MNKHFIPEKLYRNIVSSVPTCCVDAVVVCDNQFLLAKREKAPLKNHWWFPGGRLFFMESPKVGIKRKLKEELGINAVKRIELLDVGENKYYQKGYFNLPSHTINVVFLAEISKKEADKIRLDFQHSKFQWFQKIPKRSQSYIKKSLKLSGFK